MDDTSPPSAHRLAFFNLAAALAVVVCAVTRAAPTLDEAATFAFTDRYCSNCHNDVDREGGLDLTSLKYSPTDAANFALWVKVHDRVQAGEMPPKEKKRPNAEEQAGFVRNLASSLTAAEQAMVARDGRATERRLNRYEYQNALRDLLSAPWLQVMNQLPEDGEAFRFNKVSNALDVSYVHMTRYMLAADYALRQAMRAQLIRPETTLRRIYAREERGLTRFRTRVDGNPTPDRNTFPALGTKAQPDVRALQAPFTVGASEPEIREQEAVGWMSSNYPPGAFDTGWPSFLAPVAGRYRIRFSGYTVWVGPGGFSRPTRGTGANKAQVDGPVQWFLPNFDDVSPGRRNEPITVYARDGSNYRRLGAFDLTPEPLVSDLEPVWLLANEMIVSDSARFYRSRPPKYTNTLAQKDGTPAVAFRWMEVEGPLYDEATGAGYRLLFGNLPLKKVEAATAAAEAQVKSRAGRIDRGERGRVAAEPVMEVESTNPKADAERLLRAFLGRAYRRPVGEPDVPRFLALFHQQFDGGSGFTESMLTMYTAVLASPGFVYVEEKPGRLDDHPLATRLALLLWNSTPDEALRTRAAHGELHRPEVLRVETDRMLADAKSRRFVEAFLDYWLDIRKMDDTNPSTTLYSDYYLDEALTEAALEETRLYFTELLQRDLPARNIVDSNFAFLNERLAVHYGLAGVSGAAMRRVALPADSVRGGLMTQASVLKVTANGTTTSPVLRGKWIMERIVGFDVPLPPAAVPAVEPDIRGAVTIRQQLDKHRADESCAMCHRKIDPPGFALESFDVLGGWRDRYRATATEQDPEKGFGHNGQPFAFYLAQPVDPSGQLADGRAFKDVREFKRLLLQDEAQIARAFAKQLTVYATGAPVRFGDRARIEQILQGARARGYGIRSIVNEIIQSDLFLNK